MKSNTTAIWFVLATALAASVWFVEKRLTPAAPTTNAILPGLRADQVTGIQIIPAGAQEISVRRTNQVWQLEKPFAYPAQTADIQGLLGALEKLTPVLPLTAAEMSGRQNADAEFGFENPRFTLDVTAGEQSWHLRIGNRTAPGDGVYVRIVGAAGALVTDANWLQFLPHTAADWRDTTLVDTAGTVDWIVITNGANIELRRDATNRLWRMTRPLQTRANNLRIVTALQQLRSAQVSQFVNDDPKADLATYGLDPAALDICLGQGTNVLTALHAGKEVAGHPGQIFARREGFNAIVSTAKESLSPWRGTVNDFRDPQLVELTAPVAEIEVRGENRENDFTLQSSGSNVWTVAGEKFPVDTDSVQAFIKLLAGFRIADFVQDVVTGPGLQSYGLTNGARQITLRAALGDTNRVIAQLRFGAVTTNQVYVKRGDEDFVYALSRTDFERLPLGGVEFRERRLWNFSETNVASVTLRQNGKMMQLVRLGTNQWSVAAGSGIINPPAVEETVHRLGELTAAGWLGRGPAALEKIGLNTNNLSLTIELKSGEKHDLDFGVQIDNHVIQTALVAATLDGERWAFVFPPAVYPLVASYLTLPPPPAAP